jgi:hypothetical protein
MKRRPRPVVKICAIGGEMRWWRLDGEVDEMVSLREWLWVCVRGRLGWESGQEVGEGDVEEMRGRR